MGSVIDRPTRKLFLTFFGVTNGGFFAQGAFSCAALPRAIGLNPLCY